MDVFPSPLCSLDQFSCSLFFVGCLCDHFLLGLDPPDVHTRNRFSALGLHYIGTCKSIPDHNTFLTWLLPRCSIPWSLLFPSWSCQSPFPEEQIPSLRRRRKSARSRHFAWEKNAKNVSDLQDFFFLKCLRMTNFMKLSLVNRYIAYFV